MLRIKYSKNNIEAGCDEAGRGCLAGPVYAAAVVLPDTYNNPLLNDSKQISRKQRDILRVDIETNAIAWAVASFSAEEIDEVNILNASFLSMHRALDQLSIKPDLLLIDGNRFITYANIEHKCIVKGDSKFMSIAAASILAKTHRDEYMNKIHEEYPYYFWNRNKGYPTYQHKLAISKHGLSRYHRRSFNYNLQMKLEL